MKSPLNGEGPRRGRHHHSVDARPPQVRKRRPVEQVQKCCGFDGERFQAWRQCIEVLAPLALAMVGDHAYLLKAGAAADLVDGAGEVGATVDQSVDLRLRAAVNTAVGQLCDTCGGKLGTPGGHDL